MDRDTSHMHGINDRDATHTGSRLIPAADWLQVILPLLQEGHQLKISPQGKSMIPFLEGGRDEAVLSVPSAEYVFQKNDVILFQLDDGICVLHRICKINEQGIYALGDGNTTKEGPLQAEDVLAVVDYVIRKGKVIQNDNRMYVFLVNVWRFIRPFRPLVIRWYTILRYWEYRLKQRFTRHGDGVE